MKRKRTDSSTESPSKRSTRSNISLPATPTSTAKRQRTTRTSIATESSDELTKTPIKSAQKIEVNGTNTPLQRNGSTRPNRGTPRRRNKSPEIQEMVAVEKSVPKKSLVSMSSHTSRVLRETDSPTRARSPPSTNVKSRLQSTPSTKINGAEEATPVTITKQIAHEMAKGELERVITRGIQRNQMDDDGEDSPDDDEESEESEESENDDDEEGEEETGQKGITLAVSYENFFQHSGKKKKSSTSNNTLSQLPSLTLQESVALLASVPDHHAAEIQNLHDHHRQQFTQWKYEVDNGYNILLFGYGSKRALIEAFGREELAEEMSVLVINGYFPTISLDSILVQILQHIAPKVAMTGDKLNLIQSHLSQPLALLVHSLDSPVLRQPKNQQILSTLASNKHIIIIASVDHVNAPLLFDSLRSSRYNFLWHDATTFQPYRTELSFDTTTFLAGGASATSSVGGLAGIKAVLTNLTTNARALYKLLLQHQSPLHAESSNEPGTQEQGITFAQLRQLCAKKILPLANPATLRGLLGEFFDHGLVVRNDGRGSGTAVGGKGRGAGEVLFAPFGKNVVSEVLEFLGGQVEG